MVNGTRAMSVVRLRTDGGHWLSRVATQDESFLQDTLRIVVSLMGDRFRRAGVTVFVTSSGSRFVVTAFMRSSAVQTA